ncbi:MAG: hypothetical protein ACYCWW_08070 [Deltaproteobacteria bacterium]
MWIAPLALALLAAAPSDDLARAQREVETELAKVSKPSPAELTVIFEGPDKGRWALGDATFSLDGQELPFAPQGGRSTVYQSQVAPGKHAVELRVAYEERKGFGLLTYADTKYHVEKRLEVRAERGLRVKLVLAVDVDEQAAANSKLRLRATPLAELIDYQNGPGGRGADEDGKAELAWRPPPAPASAPVATRETAPRPSPEIAAAVEPAAPVPAVRHRRVVREVLGLRAERPAVSEPTRSARHPSRAPPPEAAPPPPEVAVAQAPSAPTPSPAAPPPAAPVAAAAPTPLPEPEARFTLLGRPAVPVALGLGALALVAFFALRRRA